MDGVPDIRKGHVFSTRTSHAEHVSVEQSMSWGVGTVDTFSGKRRGSHA